MRKYLLGAIGNLPYHWLFPNHFAYFFIQYTVFVTSERKNQNEKN